MLYNNVDLHRKWSVLSIGDRKASNVWHTMPWTWEIKMLCLLLCTKQMIAVQSLNTIIGSQSVLVFALLLIPLNWLIFNIFDTTKCCFPLSTFIFMRPNAISICLKIIWSSVKVKHKIEMINWAVYYCCCCCLNYIFFCTTEK